MSQTRSLPAPGPRGIHGQRSVAPYLPLSLFLILFSFSPGDDQHIQYLRKALSEAAKCIPTPTAFCVGCVLVARYPEQQPVLLATGYSRELPGNTHAEANALAKARNLSPAQLAELFPTGANNNEPGIDDVLAHTDVYTTLEPCSVRTSGLAPCAVALVAARVSRCFIGVGEPGDFVQCEGARMLRAAGCQVVWLKGLEKECLEAARRGHPAGDS
jgi:pyrimidine deaminase RibD-like protein